MWFSLKSRLLVILCFVFPVFTIQNLTVSGGEVGVVKGGDNVTVTWWKDEVDGSNMTLQAQGLSNQAVRDFGPFRNIDPDTRSKDIAVPTEIVPGTYCFIALGNIRPSNVQSNLFTVVLSPRSSGSAFSTSSTPLVGTSTMSSSENRSHIAPGPIAGIVIGAILLVAILVIAVLYRKRFHTKNKYYVSSVNANTRDNTVPEPFITDKDSGFSPSTSAHTVENSVGTDLRGKSQQCHRQASTSRVSSPAVDLPVVETASSPLRMREIDAGPVDYEDQIEQSEGTLPPEYGDVFAVARNTAPMIPEHLIVTGVHENEKS